MATEIQRPMPTKNRVINWLQRDFQGGYKSSGYRRDLAVVIIDRKVK